MWTGKLAGHLGTPSPLLNTTFRISYLLNAQNDSASRPFGVRAGPRADPLTGQVAPCSRSKLALFFRSVPQIQQNFGKAHNFPPKSGIEAERQGRNAVPQQAKLRRRAFIQSQ